MEANNHFNYGSHSSANSGLKRSSGESSYTNGSATSFPQQGKNLNGELNVNGISTVVGSGVSGSQQQNASYPHLSNLHQSSRGYEYLWGGHPQYGQLGTPHQKQPAPGLGPPHYQSRGQYQLNGRIDGSHQPPGVGPPNMPLSAGQYWNSGSEHINFSSHNLYGAYQSQALHQQQSAQSSSSQQLLGQRHPLHPQQQHYGLMPNGMPYYQQQPSQPQNQAQILPPVGQSYTPPRGSSLPVSSPSVRSPSSTKDSVSPQRPSRDRSPDTNKAGQATVVQVHTDADITSTNKERSSQKNGDDQPKDAASHLEGFSPHSEISPSRSSDISSPKKETAAKVPPETSFSSSATLSSTLSPKSSVQSSAEANSNQTTPSQRSPSSRTDALTHSYSHFRSVVTGRFETTDEAPKKLSLDSSNTVARLSPGRQFFPSMLHQAKGTSGSQVSAPASSSSLGITPLSTLPKNVQGSTAPLKTACFPDSTDDMHEKFPMQISANSSVSVIARADGSAALAPAKSLHYEVANVSPHPPPGSVSGVPMSASTETHIISSAGNDSSTARPLSALPRLTTQASRTAPASISADPVSAPHAKGTTSGVIQSYEQHSRNATPTHFLKPDHHHEDGHELVTSDSLHDRNGSHLDSAAERIKYNFQAAEKPDLPVQHLPTIISPVHKPHDGQTSIDHMQRAFASERSAVIQGRLQHSSRISYLSNESAYGESSYIDSNNASLLDTSDELSTAYTTRDSSFLADDTRDHTFASTAGETSQSFHGAESSLNSTSQMEEPSIRSTDVSMSHSYTSSQPSHQGYGDQWTVDGHDTPDSSGRPRIKPFGIMTPPSFRMRDGFMAFSTPADGSALNLIHGQMKSPGKPRKPRTPKDSQTPEQVQRKPRGRTPKTKTSDGSENQEDGAKPKVTRKRKRVPKEGASVLSMDELDSISATIDAVLANAATLCTDVEKPKKKRRKKQQQQEGDVVEKGAKPNADTTAEDGEEHEDDGSTAGDSSKRRVATEEQVQFPLQHGWRREIRVRKIDNRLRGETWYYTPCGRRMKQFPEIIKYLKKHQDSVVSREHFSFSPRMPVGDFYEERETPQGAKWELLANEEVPSTIMAITGRRGRPPNPDKEKPRRSADGLPRRPGRPPKPKMTDFLSKPDARILSQLEAKETLTDEDKKTIAKIKKKIKRKARMKRKQDAKIKKIKEEKKKAKLEQEASGAAGKPVSTDQSLSESTEPKKRGRRRSVKVEPPVVQLTDEERIAQGKRVLGARSKAKALAKAQAEAEAATRAAQAAKRAAERRVLAQKRLEERRRQQMIAEELKKPAEDMCLTDHKPLPELSRIPGVVLSGSSFAHCLSVVEFLHAYGKMLGLNIPKDVPSLATLQEGLLGLEESQEALQDLLIKLLDVALQDPGLPSHCQSVKILGDKLVDLELTRSTVSEVLRIFIEAHGYDTEVCNTLRTKTFQALPPDTKASILSFLVDELNGSNIVTNDIDNTLENMSNYRKNKWIIEGKLRRLKVELARRTGRSEEEMCFEDRRRSARVAEEETSSFEPRGRGRRKRLKTEPKFSDSENPNNSSLPELERQIDKLTKRQVFFRKKLLQSSQSMRAILLGQDRYRRRYIALPNLGMVLVEGPEEILTSDEVAVAEVPVTFLKNEPKKELKTEETSVPTTPPSAVLSPSQAAQTLSPGNDPLPGTASLMSQPRGRGRPRKIKPEVELHLRTAKIRRRRRSSARSGGEEGPASPHSDLTQAALRLSQPHEPLANGTGADAEESVKDMAEKQGQWFNLLPKHPCDEKSLSQTHAPASPQSPPKLSPQSPPKLSPQVPQRDLSSTPPPFQPDPESSLASTEAPSSGPASSPAPAPSLCPAPVSAVSAAAEAEPQPSADGPPVLESCPPTLPAPKTSPAPTPGRPGRRRRRGSSPARRGARGVAARRRGRPATAVFQELEQQYFTQMVVRPVPLSMVRGWWWIKTPGELFNTLQALHPRGVRERVLHKHLAKHMESLSEMCTKPINDPLFDMKVEQKDRLLEALQQPWQVQERAMQSDLSALKWVEELEQRVVTADLHLRAPPQGALSEADTSADASAPLVEFQPYTLPDPDSTRDDLQYYEHDADPKDDWTIRTKKEWSGLPRIPTHALDLAVLRLTNLERNIERRYLKEPLWIPSEVIRLAPLTPTPGEEQPMDMFSLENEITSRLRTWRQALDRCRSAPQVNLCLLHLEKAIAWERSVTKVNCQVCRKGDNDDSLLLCDGCDRGCHMYCLRPKMTQVPEGDWFCPTCVAKNVECEPNSRSCKKRTRVKKRRYEDDSSEDEATLRRSGGMATRLKEPAVTQTSPRSSAETAAAKRRRMVTRNQPDLTFCEIILMEMESHTDAWPFLEPVNPRLVPGYRRIIKSPMDFFTMRERLLQGAYCSCEDFAADAQLVFNNCELFNEDTSEVGVAGHSMRKFFESRWAEFYSNKDK
ncbi:bromodomain adjacent to zinc finger domain protein 2A [Eucyclogobius newberryi]|uniref:bromodomain adjacent to zinc finger domain protein 2A n=1 Tax=Eucyclogobius newberryi TaxID=166745 RepID=UPI003B5B4220